MVNMLCVRTARVSKLATKLQQTGFLAYERGQISILDRPRGFTFKCHGVIKERFDTLVLEHARFKFGGFVPNRTYTVSLAC
jgi:hypothetical protein